MSQTNLSKTSLLSFALVLTDGTVVANIGEAGDYLAKLSESRRERSHWKVAIQMHYHALHDPGYLKSATMALKTALLLDGYLSRPLPLDMH